MVDGSTVEAAAEDGLGIQQGFAKAPVTSWLLAVMRFGESLLLLRSRAEQREHAGTSKTSATLT